MDSLKTDRQQSLINIIKQHANKPFEWGEHDCALFVANVLMELHGVDYAAPFRGQYDSAMGSYRVLKPYDGLLGYLNQTFQPIPVKQAQRGDIVSIDININERAVGLVTGSRAAFVTPDDGLIYAPMNLWGYAWRVG